jgi:hypothetical protein
MERQTHTEFIKKIEKVSAGRKKKDERAILR